MRLAEQISGFLRPALAAGDPILIAVQSDKHAGIREALDGDQGHLDIVPMEEVGRNPGRLISLWHDFVERNGRADRAVWGVGEPIYPGRDAAELVEGQIHERLLNEAFAGSRFPLRVGCPYDTSSLPAGVIVEMERSHPSIGTGLSSWESRQFQAGNGLGGPPLPPAPMNDDAFVPFSTEGLRGLRRHLAIAARKVGVAKGRIPDLLLAIDEIASNSILYAGGGSLGVWAEGGRLVCEVRDRGFIDNPLVGRRRPRATQERGRGIWLAHQVADLLQLRSYPTGTTVRIMFDCDLAPDLRSIAAVWR